MTVHSIGNVFETRVKKDWRAVKLRVMVARSRIRGLGGSYGCRGMDEGHHREDENQTDTLYSSSGAVSFQDVSECFQLPINAFSTVPLGHPQDHVVASQHPVFGIPFEAQNCDFTFPQLLIV
eukprot:2423967-Amphidinium_carterae.1